MISIILATKNRSEKIEACLRSIFVAGKEYKDWELLVLDQGGGSEVRKMVNKIIGKGKSRYFQLKTSGKTKSLNQGIKRSMGELLAFTDDDCIVDKNWLLEIDRYFAKNKDVEVGFGNVYPYEKTAKEGYYCPATFVIESDNTRSGLEAVRPNIDFGSGNNMVVRKSAFDKYGLFSEWLGPGSQGFAADETEFLWRVLAGGGAYGLNSKMVVWHDRWLTHSEIEKAYSKYSSSLVAAAGYHLFGQNWKTAKKWILVKIDERLGAKIMTIWGKMISILKECVFVIWEVWYLVRGLGWGVYCRIKTDRGK